MITKHGDSKSINFSIPLRVNVCPNTIECGQEFVLLHVRPNGDVWEQVGKNVGKPLCCPYCKTELGRNDDGSV